MAKAAKAKVIKPFVLKNIKAKEFEDLLFQHGACAMAREWAKGKSLKQVFKSCHKSSWLEWLLLIMVADDGYAHTTCNYWSHSRKEIAAWGGKVRMQRAQNHADKVYYKEFEDRYADLKVRSKTRSERAADVYRQYYTVE